MKPEEQTPRMRMTSTVHSIRTLRKMLAAVPKHRMDRDEMGISARDMFERVQNELRVLRKSLRRENSPKTWVEKTKSMITANTNAAIGFLMADRRRTRFDVEVGGKADRTGHAFKSKVSSRMTFLLGYLWYSRVYQQLVFQRLTNGKDIILLDAMEYRINVKGVRLYAVTAYDFKTKKEVKGYIGQSTLDNKTVFKKTVKEAINAAQNLTVRSVNEKLGVNNV